MAVRQLMKIKVDAPAQGPVENPGGDLVIEYPFSGQDVWGYQKVYATSPTASSVDFYLDNVQVSNSYRFRPDSTDLSTDQSTYWINDGVNVGALSNGSHTIKVVANYANNTKTTKTRTVNVVSSAITMPPIPSATNANGVANTVISRSFVDESVTMQSSKNSNGTYNYTTVQDVRYYREVFVLNHGNRYEDTVQVLIPEDVWEASQPNSGLPKPATPVVWFVHGAGGDHSTLNATAAGHVNHGRYAVARGGIAISCDYGGTLYTHPDAQYRLQSAYRYLANRFNISKAFFRGTSHGGALSTLAVGRDLIPNIRGMLLGVGVYNVEDDTGGSANVGVWADPDDIESKHPGMKQAMQLAGYWDDYLASCVYTAFGGNQNLAAKNNPARLSRFNFVGKDIQLFADNNPTPSYNTYLNDKIANRATKPGDTTVDYQIHGAMFQQNITSHGGPQPNSFGFGPSDEGHTESGITDFTLRYYQMLMNFINNP
ncbi:MAG: hypothetical protein WAQ27_02185 [Candidatus Microsaccharimonas sp.]